MGKRTEDSGKESNKRDPDLAAAEIAMRRAAQRARQRVRQVGSGVEVWKDAHVVEASQNMPVGE